MIDLKPKHELFAHGLADGLSQEAAYLKAGYSAKSARANASVLLKQKPYILERCSEILEQRRKQTEHVGAQATAQAVASTRLSKEELITNLRDIRDMGMQAVPVLDAKGKETGTFQQNLPAAIKAVVLLGQELFGAFVDKKEIRTAKIEDLSDQELLERTKVEAAKVGIPLPADFTIQ